MFEGKVAVVTGATGALGSVVVRELVGRGAEVVLFLASDASEPIRGIAVTVYGRS